jgi:peroxiredoxin Q/BCP
MVSLDDPAKNLEFAQSLDGNFPLLSDPEKKTADAYGVLALGGFWAKRWTFYIDVDGVIRHIDKNVSPATAGLDIAKQLEVLAFPMKM